jgi:hypothetical protein
MGRSSQNLSIYLSIYLFIYLFTYTMALQELICHTNSSAARCPEIAFEGAGRVHIEYSQFCVVSAIKLCPREVFPQHPVVVQRLRHCQGDGKVDVKAAARDRVAGKNKDCVGSRRPPRHEDRGGLPFSKVQSPQRQLQHARQGHVILDKQHTSTFANMLRGII